MGETTSEYMHLVVNTIIFCSAIGILVVFLAVLSKYNKGEIESQRDKASVTMDTEYGYSDEYIYVLGSEVYTDIINQDPDLPIYLDGTQIHPDYLKYLRENNKMYVNDLKTLISMNDEYLIKYEYYSTNEIKAVKYEHR